MYILTRFTPIFKVITRAHNAWMLTGTLYYRTEWCQLRTSSAPDLTDNNLQ